MKINNCIIYLVLKPDDLISKLSINQWNEFIESYEKDEEAIVETYDEKMDGFVFITTNLYNILCKHSILDLRFNLGFRSEYHKTDYSEIYNKLYEKTDNK